MRFAVAVAVAAAVAVLAGCGAAAPAPQQPAPTAATPPAPVAPPPDAIVSERFDIAIAVPAGEDHGTFITDHLTTWQVEHVDLGHTDGRLVSVMAIGDRGGSALALARELRDQIAAQDGNQCELPEPAEFLGRDGARFTCVLGDGKGTWYFSSTERCNWSAMISKRGPDAEYEPYVAAMLAKITVASGAKTPNVEACY